MWERDYIPALISAGVGDAVWLYDLHKKVHLALAPRNFESFMEYMEWEREPEKKFYHPRRGGLKPAVDALQELADDRIDILCLSEPPGVGKTTLAIFFLVWLAGRDPEHSILGASHSISMMRGVYEECLNMMRPGEYLYADVFPERSVVRTNAQDLMIDVDRKQRFSTLQFTAIGAQNAGRFRAQSLLYCDDLVDGIETAMNPERLAKLYEKYNTDLRQRKQGDCKELHIATRWSVHDVIGKLQQRYKTMERCKFIAFPALNDEGESNFDYPYGVGFSTQMYKEQRDIMDEVSWKCLYMNQPIEREGLLYDVEELRRYYDLPVEGPDAVIAICDTKDKGDDYCVMPILYQYGDNFYLEDIICDNGKPELIDERLVEILLKHNVKLCRFESNSAGGRVAEKIRDKIKERGGITSISTKYTTANKETKIVVNSPWVKEHILFRNAYKVNGDYGKAMQMLCGYTMMGKNRHDDVPDALAMAAEFAQSLDGTTVQVLKRPF